MADSYQNYPIPQKRPILKVERSGETKILGQLARTPLYDCLRAEIRQKFNLPEETHFKIFHLLWLPLQSQYEKLEIDTQLGLDYICSRLDPSFDSLKLYVSDQASEILTENQKNLELSIWTNPGDTILNRYTEWLKKAVKPLNSSFDDILNKENILPCKHCLGKKYSERFTDGEKCKIGCSYCGETGEKPLNQKWNLIIKIVEQKFRSLL
jgi:hypothetical protein